MPRIMSSVLSCLGPRPSRPRWLSTGRGTTDLHPKGETKWQAAADGFFASRCKAGIAGGGKKPFDAVAGRQAALGQTSLSRGRVAAPPGKISGLAEGRW